MKCHKCGSSINKISGDLQLEDVKIGSFEVYNVEYFKCDGCNRLFFTEETTKAIEAQKTEKRNQLLSQLPISDFIGATEAAGILGISRQALHKHRRIRRGFIYAIKFEGRTVYNKKSVGLFKETGDGRFCLIQQQEATPVEYSPFLPTPQVYEYSEISNTPDFPDWIPPDLFSSQENNRYL